MGMKNSTLAELARVLDVEIGRAASSLELMLGRSLELAIQNIKVRPHEFTVADASEGEALETVVIQDFTGKVPGRALLIFSDSASLELAGAIGGKEHELTELDSDFRGIVIEFSNVVLNAVLASFSQITETEFTYAIPQFNVKQSPWQVLQEMVISDSSSECFLCTAELHTQIAGSEWRSQLVALFQCDALVNKFLDSLNLTALSE